ncbi:MAG: recombinase RecT [Candidatus Methanoperedens sp.]|nr:recombinase RecT [Candidatus Methanoperedens sp.]
MSDNLPARTGTVKSVQGLLEKNKKQFQLVLPKTLSLDRFLRIALSAVTINPKLLQCEEKTFLRSLLQSASLGLEPGGPLGLSHLVPFYNGQRGQLECQLIVDYKGYVALAHRSKEVGRIAAHIVFENEPFKFTEGDVIVHTPLPPSERGKKKKLAYAKAFDRQGVLIAQEFLWAEEIEDIKSKSLANKKNVAANPWNTNEEMMWRKSPVRRMAKWMPMSTEMQKAAIIEEYQEQGIDVPLDTDLSLDEAPPVVDAAQKTEAKENALTEKLKQAQGQSEPGAPARKSPELRAKVAEETPDPPDMPGDVVDAELDDPGPGDSPPGDDTPQPTGVGSEQQVPLSLPSAEPPPSAVHPSANRKSKEPETFGPSKGPRLERGKKAEDYWLNTNQVKCPPGGERAGLIALTSFCNGHCQYRKRCFVFKD